MPVEKSAGAVVFRKEQGKIFYLLLHYPKGSRTKNDFWDFPKGHIENGEDELACMKREIKEETGLSGLKVLEGFKRAIKYYFRAQGKNIFKTVVFYLVQTDEERVVISDEHQGYLWADYDQALKKLKFKNAKETLRRTTEFLSER